MQLRLLVANVDVFVPLGEKEAEEGAWRVLRCDRRRRQQGRVRGHRQQQVKYFSELSRAAAVTGEDAINTCSRLRT